MSYYDNIKDNVRENNKNENNEEGGNSTGSHSSSGGGNFDTLKQAAEEEDVEEKSDDTPIEVLEEDGLKKEPSNESRNSRSEKSSKSRANSSPGVQEDNGNAELEEISEKMDKIIEQNKKMIEILDSFGN